jgi:hypothetical protein
MSSAGKKPSGSVRKLQKAGRLLDAMHVVAVAMWLRSVSARLPFHRNSSLDAARLWLLELDAVRFGGIR